MDTYPVHYDATRPQRSTRLQLALRLLALLLVGATGLSVGWLFLIAFVALPAVAAVRIAGYGDSTPYLERDAGVLLRGLAWAAAVTGWLGFVSERLPQRVPDEEIRLRVKRVGHPRPGEALVHVLTGIPSALVLAILSFFGLFVWLWAALSVLVNERVGPHAWAYLAGLQRWTYRLLAYQCALVDVYPPFTLDEGPTPAGVERHA